MFLIRRVLDAQLPANREAFEEVKRIWRAQFKAVREEEITLLFDQLTDPTAHQIRRILYVAQRRTLSVQGFAIAMIEPTVGYWFLDYIAVDPGASLGGTGGALYDVVREDARLADARGLFLEVPPEDDETQSEELLRANRRRVRFYSKHGAYRIMSTGYEAPIKPGETGLPHLLYDDLDREVPLGRRFAQKAVRSILQLKYAHLCPPEYVDKVVASFRDDPVLLLKPERSSHRPRKAPRRSERIALFVNDKHDIHHVRERGYVEAPIRIAQILSRLPEEQFEHLDPTEHSLKYIKAIHEPEFVDYLANVCATIPANKSLYPYVFPIRNATRPPKELSVRAGYYCIDTFTPLNRNAYLAARGAIDCALSAAELLTMGRRAAYALVRPPGHHAERRAFGGFCYFNNAAAAAHMLSSFGRVAILDLDYHHGNGQQDIFFERSDVLTVSIHGHPNFAYPYFSGFEEEVGTGPGAGFNFNIPLPEKVAGSRYRRALEVALTRVAEFRPLFVVVCLGLDTAKGDPTGSWTLEAEDFLRNGQAVARLGRPILIVQEGGYRTRTLGTNARYFFEGLSEGLRG